MTTAALGLPEPATSTWLLANVPWLTPPLTYRRCAGGMSNLTTSVTDATGRQVVVRRPPLGALLSTAHDVLREARILTALAGTAVPVPPVLAACRDADMVGAPFFVMAHVEGHVLRRAADAEAKLPQDARPALAEDFVTALAALHALEPAAVGLGDLGRSQGYVERQLRRWHRQWEQSRTRDLPLVDAVHDRLAASVPAQPRTAVVHGDFKVDNLIVGGDGAVRAVLDWELATLGDPLADLGTALAYWAEPGTVEGDVLSGPTAAPGFPRRDEITARYGQLSGLDVSGIDYYLALAQWKIACIAEGVLARLQSGAIGDVEAGLLVSIARSVEARAAEAQTLLAGTP